MNKQFYFYFCEANLWKVFQNERIRWMNELLENMMHSPSICISKGKGRGLGSLGSSESSYKFSSRMLLKLLEKNPTIRTLESISFASSHASPFIFSSSWRKSTNIFYSCMFQSFIDVNNHNVFYEYFIVDHHFLCCWMNIVVSCFANREDFGYINQSTGRV